MSELSTDNENYDEFVAEAVNKGWLEPVIIGDDISFFPGPNISEFPELENLLQKAMLAEAQETLDSLADQGMIYAAGTNVDGETYYELTDLGKSMTEGDYGQ